MSDRGTDKSASPVPSQEECDELYSKARTSLDGRAAPFVPGVGRLSQDFNSIDLSAIATDSGGERERDRDGDCCYCIAYCGTQDTFNPPLAHHCCTIIHM